MCSVHSSTPTKNNRKQRAHSMHTACTQQVETAVLVVVVVQQVQRAHSQRGGLMFFPVGVVGTACWLPPVRGARLSSPVRSRFISYEKWGANIARLIERYTDEHGLRHRQYLRHHRQRGRHVTIRKVA